MPQNSDENLGRPTLPLWADLILVVAGAGMMVLAWPDFDIEILAFVALAPLLVRLPDISFRRTILYSLIWAFLYNLGCIYWLYPVAGLGTVGLALLFSFPTAVCLGPARWAILRKPGAGWILLPFLWTAIEYPQAALPITFPWFLIGNSQYLNPITQVSSITGIYGMSFLIVATNACIAFWVRKCLQREEKSVAIEARITTAVFVFLMICLLVWGRARKAQPASGERVAVALLQGNYDHLDKWNQKNLSKIQSDYSELSAMAGHENPDLVVWPETAIPQVINTDTPSPDTDEAKLRQSSRLNVEESVRRAGAFSLVGGLRSPADPGTEGNYNASFLFDEKGKLTEQEYYKRNRVPFGEYVPWNNILFFVDIVSAGAAIFLKGERDTVFEVPWRERNLKFGVLICYESLFPHMGREHVANGADLLVVTSNDSWYGKTTMPHQIAAMAVIRAIESGVPMVRSANTGLTLWCDARGNIQQVLTDEQGQSLFVEGYLMARPRMENLDTAYVRFGDAFAWLCVIVSAAMLSLALYPGRHTSAGI
ncbi:MAG: apolipoprotein N-acyltransferase [Planctomycetota bacterium]|nr:apolipoprotein N-acyltransferase [Planctomycetota bacterium]